ncbi:retrovirus-related pol polyprotein from transposon TNT 1-94 [Trifolium medium]|uniref:Retrovirus-related pol polyprotein from transposon TNT 1-94 n=1 Tax=Trifolium medium TaxID=97028 RepID=A0A392MA30_9FABA|nr:retrovirus-related pol polyprotein from transposon TNT 1-94 [Trifolium medium]
MMKKWFGGSHQQDLHLTTIALLSSAAHRSIHFSFSSAIARGGSTSNAGGATTTALYPDPSNNPGDVYYVHPSDGPNSITVKPVLNHSNYQVWARSMRRVLGEVKAEDVVMVVILLLKEAINQTVSVQRTRNVLIVRRGKIYIDETKSVRGSNGNDSFSFTKEQYTQLVNLLQASNAANQHHSSSKVNIASGHVASGTTKFAYYLNSSAFGSWIVDSGASDHIFSIHVRLPNGHASIAKYAGTVQFYPGFLVSQVLYVPDFHLNLLSVPKLCIDNQYIVSFDNDRCLIQVRQNLNMIGLAELVKGLYYLTIPNNSTIPKASVNTSSQAHSPNHIPQDALWHFRL